MDMDKQYDLSPREMDLVHKRAALRSQLRAHFLKEATNPHNYTTEGGYLFDPAMQRWQSMRANQYPYFKANWKTAIFPLFVVSSCLAYGHLFKVRRARRDKLYREGRVSYRDRDFKFV